MATWDGSYSGPSDQNYYVYQGHNVPGPGTENWAYFSNSVNNDYMPPNPQFCVENGPALEQNSSRNFFHLSSNMVAGSNNGHEHFAEPISTTQVLNNHKYFANNVKPPRCYVSDKYGNHNYDVKRTKAKRNWPKKGIGEAMQGNNSQFEPHVIVENFISNNVEAGGSKHESHDAESVGSANPCIKDYNGSSDKYFVNNMSRQDKKYNNRKSSNQKPKDGQRDQFYKGNPYTKSFQQQQGKSPYKSKDKSATNPVGFNRKKGYITNSNDEELSSNGDVNLSKNTYSSSTGNGEEVASTQDNNVTHNGMQDSQNQVKEFSYFNTGSKQLFSNCRNVRKQSYNRSNRDGNSYRDKRYNYHGYNRENYNKEVKAVGKDHDGCTSGYSEFKEYPSKEANTESKEKKERKFKYSGSEEIRENIKENKAVVYEEKDKSKYYTFDSKQRGHEHWRNKRESNERSVTQHLGQIKKSTVDDDANQRERLVDQLNRGQLECLVCCEYIKQNDYIWSCSNCYHVLHLKCIRKWATSSQAENGWRCPACQNVSLLLPKDYYCFCGKTRIPEWNHRDVAHSCGEICGRMLSRNTCPHKCTLLCHPGSCPECTAMITKDCGCGKTSQTVLCGSRKLLLCDSVCGKDLNCGNHKCERKCHHDECSHCTYTITQACYCGKHTQDVTCDANVPTMYSCGEVCGKLLNCGNHTCKKLCHADACEPCSLTPERVTTCCCGQTALTETRKSCLDPIPTCNKICAKNLKCGQSNNPHVCKVKCHEGDCPVCDLTTDVKCRCGNMDREIACKDLTTKADDARCEKRCTKKRSCGKHKCNQFCCIEIEHVCPLICSKTLTCGRHKCEQSCHKGRCQPCWHSSFEELYCECGASVIYPPVPCGTRRPICDRPCSRQHSCGHEVLHNCHSEFVCPPCTVLTQRWCYGKHELRKAVPCYVNEISCGLPCNKPLSCGRHKCISTCHSGPCEKPGQKCTQPCTTPRETCGHICSAPCHEDKCPDIPCKEMVKVTCQCGHRTTTRVCAENSKEYQRIASNILASKMADMQLGNSVNLDQVFGQGAKKQNQLKTLECNEECRLIERNKRLALGLQIVNPDLSGKLMPRYNDFMKQWAKKDPLFCQMVHDKLTELVQLAKTSKQKSRSYSFDCMNKDKRHFVHDSCEHFGCESQSYDREPKRNVVATAVKDKCWLPSYSLLEIVQRENGQRKVPGPMLNTSKSDGSVKTILSLPVRKIQKPDTSIRDKSPEPEIDYFDFKGK